MSALWLGMVALAPLALGTTSASGATMSVSLCSGGEVRTVDVPTPGKAPEMPADCAIKASHAACQRKQIDRAQ